jgi:hypothetical protein
MEQVSGSAMWRNYSAFMLALALAMIAPSQLQADDRLIRIGVLRPGSPPDPLTETFRQALGDLGYVEGRNLSLEVRWADGKDERLSGLAAELVRLKVDVIESKKETKLGERRRQRLTARAKDCETLDAMWKATLTWQSACCSGTASTLCTRWTGVGGCMPQVTT